MPAPLIPSPEDTRAASAPALADNGGAPAGGPIQPTKAQLDARNAAIDSAQKTETNNANSANTLADATGSSSTQPPFISSSDAIETNENHISSVVNDLNSNNQATTDAHNSYLTQLSQETAALEARRAADEASVNSEFDAQKKDLDATQTNETGAETVMLQRAGGYLGTGASQTGALISLAQTHATEQAQLESKRQAAISAARNAVDDKEFTVADARAKEAKDYASAIQQNRQDYLDNQLKIQKSTDDAKAAATNEADKQLKGLSSLSPDEITKIDPATLTKIDQAYGVPGFAKNYIAATSAANAAKSRSDVIDAQQKLLNLLQDIPQGQKVTFADPSDPSGPGISYTGMGKIGDIATFQESDNYGNVTIVSYNKATNTITRTGAGNIGKTSAAVDSARETGTRLKNVDEFISDPKNNILVPADPSNPNSPKYMTADNYVAMYQKYVKIYPGQGDEFKKQYPVENTVLPSQRKSSELNAFSQSDPTRVVAK